jgi:hypothetical protein
MRVVKYLVRNPARPIVIDGTAPLTVSAASDSDWGGDFKESKSTSGYFVMVGKTVVSCHSQIQRKVTDSVAMAETLALAELSKHVQSTVGILEDIGVTVPRPVQVVVDNQGVMTQSQALVNHSASKHYRVPQSIIRELVVKGFWLINQTPTADNPADTLTKPLVGIGYDKHSATLMGS